MFNKQIALLAAVLLAFTMCGKEKGSTVREIKTKSGIEMVFIPGGEFMMGGDRPGETPVHRVGLDSFYMDKYEVTQEMYRMLDLSNPSHFKGEKKPVEQVAWMNAAIYCNERSLEEGLDPCYDENSWECNYSANGYRLPTEAEWEFAARAGAQGKYFFGDLKNMKNYAVYSQNTPGGTENAGSKKPNAWGLYDMYGNVSEWCNDFYSTVYYSRSSEFNPKGPGEGTARVIRGGSWNDPESLIYSGSRGSDESFNDTCLLRDTIGFRCVRRADK